LAQDEKFAEAAEQCTQYIDLCTKDKELGDGVAAAYLLRASFYRGAGQYARAIDDYTAIIQRSPDNCMAYSQKSWLLATCKDDRVRDGRLAVDLAMRACELSHGRWSEEDTLAAAYAELGDFKQAVEHQRKALDEFDAPAAPKKVDKKPKSFSITFGGSSPSKSPSQGERRAKVVARLESYKQGQPLRE